MHSNLYDEKFNSGPIETIVVSNTSLCNRADMVKAIGLYNAMIPILTDPKYENLIQKKISLVTKTIKERGAWPLPA